jgi:Fur family transcriptional regulator, ferric uptake regulator
MLLARYSMNQTLEQKCADRGLKMTGQRRTIVRVIAESTDHPDVEMLHARAVKLDAHVSIATVYRTVKLLEEAGIIARHEFGDGRARYEETPEDHHDHLIDLRSGKVIEFVNEEIERLQERIARELGYKLVDHRLELFGVPLDVDKKR